MSSDEPMTAVGVFFDRAHAEHAVAELEASGFSPDQIGFLIPDDDAKVEPPPCEPGNRAEKGAGLGALAGGTFGGLVGAALAASVLPGVGPVLAGGLLVGAIEAALAGAGGGALLGLLIGLRVPEEKARHCHAEFHSGRTLVTVRADGRYDEATAILERAAEWEEKRRCPYVGGFDAIDAGCDDGYGRAFVPRP